MEEIVKCIMKEDPDVIILQEMSHESIGILVGIMRRYGIATKYKRYGHHFETFTPNDLENSIGRDLDNYVLTKYIPKQITQFQLSGNLGYTSGITCVDFDDVCVVGCYLQAGSKHSVGQESVSHHYSRCRLEQLEAIGKIIDQECKNKSVILCGDFNMNLDGSIDEWPEVEGINKLNMQDTWKIVNPKDPGFTEDTFINHMRWNMKFMEKRYRYDGMFLKSDTIVLLPVDAKMVGTESCAMDDDMFDDFMRLLSNKSVIDNVQPRSKTYHPSDHFGVMTTFTRS